MTSWFVLGAFLFPSPRSSAATLDDLKKLEIICFVPESPVVTEINLDAVEKEGNEFNQDGLKQDGDWLQCPVPDRNATKKR
jgi:hypothetical protein